MERGHSAAGWRDLRQAETFNPEYGPLLEARANLTKSVMAEVEGLLHRGEPGLAEERLHRLVRRVGASGPIEHLRVLTGHLTRANGLARIGKFGDAIQEWEMAERLQPDWKWLSTRVQECRLKQQQFRRADQALHLAMMQEDWSAALEHAETLLTVAPQYGPARAARRRAWGRVGLAVTQTYPGAKRLSAAVCRAGTQPLQSDSQEGTVAGRVPGVRLQMWVDAVGGYLICLGDEIVLGPPTLEANADVALVADLSRRHAVIRREQGAYLLEPRRQVKLDRQPLTEVSTLADGQLIELGDGVELRFRQPHPLSATARLDPVSHHRTQPAADAVLLMADTCVLGPDWKNHVVCREWHSEVVLFRQGEELFCRSESDLIINGKQALGPAAVESGTQIEGESFALSVEALHQH